MVTPHASDNMTEVDFDTDSVLADDTHEAIPLTQEQWDDFFHDEDVSEYPVYGTHPESSRICDRTVLKENTVALGSKSSNTLQPAIIRPKRQEKKLTTTADALREITRDRIAAERETTRDRIAIERERLDMEKEEK